MPDYNPHFSQAVLLHFAGGNQVITVFLVGSTKSCFVWGGQSSYHALSKGVNQVIMLCLRGSSKSSCFVWGGQPNHHASSEGVNQVIMLCLKGSTKLSCFGVNQVIMLCLKGSTKPSCFVWRGQPSHHALSERINKGSKKLCLSGWTN